MNYAIRKGTHKDLPDILKLVKELAIFEKAEHLCIASLDAYTEAFNEKVFDIHVAEVDGKIAGMALFYLSFSTWRGKMLYLEDFIVKEEYRSKGIGQALFDKYLESARELGCTIAKWEILDWNERAIKFYKRNNAIIEKHWWDGKILFDGI